MKNFTLEAIENLDGTEFKGRLIRVKLATPYKKYIGRYKYIDNNGVNNLNCATGIIIFITFIYIFSRKSKS
jgi:RNA recognition motif-containing protein